MNKYLLFALISIFLGSCQAPSESIDQSAKIKDSTATQFPAELVDFMAYPSDPIFTGTGQGTWDHKIRERGYIIKEKDEYHMWYTGVPDTVDVRILKLGYATSTDGITWSRYTADPIYDDVWVEDMMVLKDGDTYYMFAEGLHDVAQLLTSKDKVKWERHGPLIIKKLDGDTLAGPYGTPTVWKENDVWYLFYERNDQGIWLASSQDLITWNNVSDDAVIEMGPEEYDQYGVAVNQIVHHNGWYYAYYHGTAFEDWSEWSTNVAVSKDLIHWKKYRGNPIMEGNKSSGILVDDGEKYRLYTMHNQVVVHFTNSDK